MDYTKNPSIHAEAIKRTWITRIKKPTLRLVLKSFKKLN